MARLNHAILNWNRGRISKLALARTDIERVGLSSEVQTNWMAGVLGSMALRVGFEYKGNTLNNSKALHIPFIFSLDDMAIIEITNGVMRVRVDESIITRPAVTAAITNGTFTSNITSWTDASEVGASSAWASSGGQGCLALLGTGYNAAIRRQQVTVNEANTEHSLNIKIVNPSPAGLLNSIGGGNVTLRVGSSSGADDYIRETSLAPGYHSLAFTPTGNFWVQFSNRKSYTTYVDSVAVGASGDMQVTCPWGEDDLSFIRYAQSADVHFVASDGFRQYRIERRATRSWSAVLYQSENGPFRAINTSDIRLTPSLLFGDISISASRAFFSADHVGALFKITSVGQRVNTALNGADQFTSIVNDIRVTGVGTSRNMSIVIAGTWAGTLTLQRSVDETGSWVDVTTYTANTSLTYNDALDNQICFYRIGFKTSAYTSGSATVSMSYSSGGLTGIARVTGYASSTLVDAQVLTPFGATTSSADWSESEWSEYRGFPSAVAFDEGRLWWAGKDKVQGSVSDAFDNFDEDIEGNSAPINRSIGDGPVDRINWLLALQRLVIGTEMSEKVIRSNSLDEILSPTVFNIKTPSTRGSTAVSPVKIDTSGIFVRNNRLFELEYDGNTFDYKTVDLTSHIPEIGGTGFVRIAVQRYPDTRIHCLKADGTVAVLIFDRNEEVKCWVDVETDGVVEDVVVMPAATDAIEDSVYYTVKRTINGATVRYFEKMALESECVGGTLNKQADSFITGTQSSSVTISGLSHLEGEAVIVWADGINYSPRVDGVQTTFTVASGAITLPSAVVDYVVGLPYKARYKSVKLSYAAYNNIMGGTSLLQSKRIEQLGVIMRDTHNRGLRYGSDFDTLYELPLVEGGKDVVANSVWEEYDERPFEFEQQFDTDSRLCLEAMAPMPCTLLACVLVLQANAKV